MTFEKTLFLSVVFHAVILSALTITLKKPYIIPRPFDVALVSPYVGRLKNEAAKSFSQKQPVAQQNVKAMPAPATEKKSAMPAETDKKAARASSEDDLIKEALATVREKTEINNAMDQVKARVKKLHQNLTINKKTKNMPASKGGAASGTGSSTPLEAYESMLIHRIWANWYFPDQKTHGIEAIITIDVLSDGTIVYKGFEKHSGNGRLDDSAVRAIQRTGKVQPPPYAMEVGVVFNPD